MNRKPCFMKRQDGAIAVMAGILLFLLMGMLALVVDLGHVYIAKTGLQNGADAAALAGAKRLNDSLAGVNAGVADAIGIARHNVYDFSLPVGTDAADGGLDIRVGSCPDPDCMVSLGSVTSNGAAAGLSYIEVNTRNRALDSWFAGIWNILNFDVSARAVAGRYVIKVTPIGVCGISSDPATEFGFIRGVAYNIPDLNPLTPGDPIWINPVDTPGSGIACNSNNGSTDVMVPYVCTGRSAVDIQLPGGRVYINTGTQEALERALNSRFGDPKSYSGGQACDPSTAPPDTNVQPYDCANNAKSSLPTGLTQVGCANGSPSSSDARWMTPAPVGQSIATWSSGANTGKPFYFPKNTHLPMTSSGTRPPSPTAADFANYGVLWSAIHESNASGQEYTTGNWPTLYGGNANAYPDPPPYQQRVAPYFRAPAGSSAYMPRPGRRVLTLAIIDCEGVVKSSGMCKQELPVLGVGQFFMTKPADMPKEIVGEFMGLATPPKPSAQITLFR